MMRSVTRSVLAPWQKFGRISPEIGLAFGLVPPHRLWTDKNMRAKPGGLARIRFALSRGFGLHPKRARHQFGKVEPQA